MRYIRFRLDGRVDQSFVTEQQIWSEIIGALPLRLVMKKGDNRELDIVYYECAEPEFLPTIIETMNTYGEARECSHAELQAELEAIPVP